MINKFLKNSFIYIIILLLQIFLTHSVISQNIPLEVDITKGKIELIPIAVSEFQGNTKDEKELGKKITKVITKNLSNSGLFKILPKEAFLQPSEELYIQPLFKDWRIIDAHILIGGKIIIQKDEIKMPIKAWDVYRENQMIGKNGKTISGIKLKFWRAAAHVASNLIYERVTGEKGYFATRMAYIAEKEIEGKRIKRLAIMDQDGANHKFLTDGSNIVLTPRFSPTNKELLYLSYANKAPRVYIFDLEKGKKRLLGEFSGMSFAPRYSMDGKKIVFSLSEDGNTNLYIKNINEKSFLKITNNRSINTSPSFSPDGNNIVFSSDRSGKQNLYIIDIANNKTKRISFKKGNYATPVWSPRGDYIAFTKMIGGNFYIGLMKPNGTRERTIAKGYLIESPTWSPNGRTLAFYRITLNSNGSKNSKLYTIDITGNRERLLNTPGHASDPSWGPSLKY